MAGNEMWLGVVFNRDKDQTVVVSLDPDRGKALIETEEKSNNLPHSVVNLMSRNFVDDLFKWFGAIGIPSDDYARMLEELAESIRNNKETT